MAFRALASLLKEHGIDHDTALNISLHIRRDPTEMINWLSANPDATPNQIWAQARSIHADSSKKELRFFEKYLGKSICSVEAFGVDEFDFTADILGSASFSVGEFGYAVFHFGDEPLYLSTDGLTDKQPQRADAVSLEVPSSVLEVILGAVLKSVKICAGGYALEFSNLPTARCTLDKNGGHCDRNYLEFQFPFA